ncbi:putative metal-dependent enzyme (double-stranded beta helix superfamily) [Nocardioides sp. BE266]|uniref:cysteine dioxygenase n=1 Tax=Nocardioides sp. BE266 TaxID=2817725 RepID=UPI00285C9EAD|nr:cysteine dioxygenase family protein [Nocardioides sp. BE266]MDR7252365.1 putative metal-dependent enzyme (double-stranded beta helix superfamily) [Nocardioides sp. BE266]
MTATFPTAHARTHTSFDARDALAERLLTDDLLASVDLTLPERTWVRLDARTESGAELWLITWPVGSSTGWHDHGSASGAFTVLRGTLTEYTFAGVATARTLATGQLRQFDGNHIHDVVNHGSGTAVSLHAYAPSLAAMTRYELVRGRLQVTGVENRGELW